MIPIYIVTLDLVKVITQFWKKIVSYALLVGLFVCLFVCLFDFWWVQEVPHLSFRSVKPDQNYRSFWDAFASTVVASL